MKQALLDWIAVVEVLRMPLHPQAKPPVLCLHCLDDSVRSHGSLEKGWSYSFDGLVMRAIHMNGSSSCNATEQASGSNLNGVGQLGCRTCRLMRNGGVEFHRNILDQGPSQSYIKRLYPTADAQDRYVISIGQFGDT